MAIVGYGCLSANNTGPTSSGNQSTSSTTEALQVAASDSTAAGAREVLPTGEDTCTVTVSHDVMTSFRTRVGELTVVGEGHANRVIPNTHRRSPDASLSLTIERAGAMVLKIDSSFSSTGVYTESLRHGGTGGAQEMRLTTDGERIEGTVNGRALTPIWRAREHEVAARVNESFTFTDGTPVPRPSVPPDVQSALERLPAAIKNVLASCKEPRLHFEAFGVPPRFDDTGGAGECAGCIAEAYAGAVGCGVACGLSFGFACACVAGVPLLFANCHSVGEGLGQGCCPVGCGPSHTTLGIGVVYQCCYGGDTCLNSTTGACCGPGLGACNQTTCCPASAPCRDVGLCCPVNQATCITSNGPVCCNEGEDCTQGICCPHGAPVINGACCSPPVFQACGNNCCPALTTKCCGDACCSGVCLNGNLCCPSALQVCENACCAPGQVCTNGTCSSSQEATLLIYDTSTNTLIARSGGPALRITNNQGLLVKGQFFPTGNVKLSVDRVGGPLIATVPAPNGSFSTTIDTGKFSGGPHKLVAIGGLQVVSVDLQVEVLQ
jgi:hypothetical protein